MKKIFTSFSIALVILLVVLFWLVMVNLFMGNNMPTWEVLMIWAL